MSGFDHNGLFFLSSYGLSSSPPTQTELIAFLNAKQHEILNRLPKSSASIGLVSDALDQKLQEYKDFLVGMSQNRILSHPFLSTQDRLKLVDGLTSLSSLIMLREAENRAREQLDEGERTKREELSRAVFAAAAGDLRAAEPQLANLGHEDSQLVYSRVLSAGPAIARGLVTVCDKVTAGENLEQTADALEYLDLLVDQWLQGAEAVAADVTNKIGYLAEKFRAEGAVQWFLSEQVRSGRAALLRALMRLADAMGQKLLAGASSVRWNGLCRRCIGDAGQLMHSHMSACEALQNGGDEERFSRALRALGADQEAFLFQLWKRLSEQIKGDESAGLVLSKDLEDDRLALDDAETLAHERQSLLLDLQRTAITYHANATLVRMHERVLVDPDAAPTERLHVYGLLLTQRGIPQFRIAPFAHEAFSALLASGQAKALMSLLPDGEEGAALRDELDELYADGGDLSAAERLEQLLLEFLLQAGRPELLYLQQLKMARYADARRTLLGLWEDAVLGRRVLSRAEAEKVLRLSRLCTKALQELDPTDSDARLAEYSFEAGLLVLLVQDEAGVQPADPMLSADALLTRFLADDLPAADRPLAALHAIRLIVGRGKAFFTGHVEAFEAAFGRLVADADAWGALTERRARGGLSDDEYRDALVASPLGSVLLLCYNAREEAIGNVAVRGVFAFARAVEVVRAAMGGAIEPAVHDLLSLCAGATGAEF